MSGHQRKGDDDESDQGGDLHRHKDRIDGRAFFRADHQKKADGSSDQNSRKVDHPTRLAALQKISDGDLGTDCKGVGQMPSDGVEEARDMA